MMTVSNLKKITVVVRDNGSGSASSVKGTPFSFVYGAASSGLSPFEVQLAECSVNERFAINIDQQDLTAYFGHLLRPLLLEMDVPVLPQRLELEVEVAEIADPPQREIVQAMAAAAGGGCGGGCGCGCQ